MFVVAAAENAIGSAAYKPHAIIKSMKGPSVRVDNTDAEGRLALADAMWYGQQRYKPHTVVDLATLTGACVIALGDYIAGAWSNDATLSQLLVDAGKDASEPVWPMPLLDEYKAELRTPQADLKSTGAGRGAGACTAAAFLSNFVDEGVNWAHLDIAGTAM